MSYQEKRTVVDVVLSALVTGAYCVYVFGRYQSGMADISDLKFIAATILTFIGIEIGAVIIVQIIFHILLSAAIAVKRGISGGEKIAKTVEVEFIEDEMDKLIELKSGRLGIVIVGAGFIASLVTLVLGSPPAVMLNIVFLSFCAGSLAGGILSLYYYRTGI